jgi:hypothetical protein
MIHRDFASIELVAGNLTKLTAVESLICENTTNIVHKNEYFSR